MEIGPDKDETPRDVRARVLIVQPQRSYLAATARRIAESGFRVAAADTVQTAAAELYRLPANLILAELNGPGFCGRELVTMVRGDVVLRDIPILLFTGRSDNAAAVEALRVGADGVVKKPFHFEVLCARIRRELERKRVLDELREDNRVLDSRVVERAIQIGELRDELAQVRATTAR
jgi:PleD family two-component response regulator